MSENFEVPTPILNGPFDPPKEHWKIAPDKPGVKMPGRRTAGYYYRPPNAPEGEGGPGGAGQWRPLETVNLIRERMAKWQADGRPGLTRTSAELIAYWRREGRGDGQRLFFAQLEAVETIIFLAEARADYLQGIAIPSDEPSEERKAEGFAAFRRQCCKMATGSGKSTVMAMLAAWSILNKVANRGDARFSDTVLAVCPNVTIRNRLQEIDPRHGEASLYRTRDLVPERLMPELRQGQVIVTNWHTLEPHGSAVGGTGARVIKAGKATEAKEKFIVAGKTTTFHGKKYITPEILDARVAKGELRVIEDKTDKNGRRIVKVEGTAYVESDTALVNRVLKEAKGKSNILVLNDEAHHAYRILSDNAADGDGDDGNGEAGEGEGDDYERKEATVWIDGLDKVNKLRGVNLCIDLSATPYFISRVGRATNTIFPWTVSDFGLTDAIESGLVKIPQLAVRDTTGRDMPEYFNLWHHILKKLTPAERGGKKSNPKPEAILKYSHMPIAMLGGLWDEMRRDWAERKDEERPPVFILVCKNTKIARVMYEWMAEDKAPAGIPSAKLDELRNRDGRIVTIRVDTKVAQETDSGEAKSDEVAWMRRRLDTVGKRDWPLDRQGRPIYPEGFEDLAQKLGRPLHPPGRDIRCIVSVGMLTEGWDCSTVTHIVGIRPFMSQLLCEQVVGRGLRRASYDVGEDGKLTEEVAKVFGVPFEVVPFKESNGGGTGKPKRFRVYAIPEKMEFAISFPRVEGYRQAIRNKVAVDWESIAPLHLDPFKFPPETDVKGLLPTDRGRPSLLGPGKLESVTLNPYRKGRRLQELAFQMARDLTRVYVTRGEGELPAHVLFPQLLAIAERFLCDKVIPQSPAERIDVFISPYYGLAIERMLEAIKPDATAGEAPELPAFEANRPDGSTGEVDFWTSRDARPVIKSHVNKVVADTKQWEQSAAYFIDKHEAVAAFVKNAGLGFAIPYLHNGQMHDYEPDFLVRLNGDPPMTVILEIKGHDPLKDVKRQAAERWVAAVNADGRYGTWRYALAQSVGEVAGAITRAAAV